MSEEMREEMLDKAVAELSLLRELAKEMRDKWQEIYSDFEFCKANGDSYGDRSASYAETARAAVAKIDATIKEICRE